MKPVSYTHLSGCGKSTLLRSLNRMNDLVENCHITGDITLDGQDIYKNCDVNPVSYTHLDVYKRQAFS